jgi:hypothetical protein
MTMSVPLATAGNIVVNPSFEQGFANWTVNNNNPTPWFIDTIPNSGSLDIATQCGGAACLSSLNGAFFYQDLSTIIGDTYNLSFFAYLEGSPNEIKVTWGGVTAVDIVNPAVPDDVYTQYSASNLLATTSITRLEFFGRDDPGQMGLDDVSVSTPEPSTLLLISVALLIGAGLRWRHLIWSGVPAEVRSKYSRK